MTNPQLGLPGPSPGEGLGSVSQLLGRARQGDAAAKNELWARYRALLYVMARDGTDDDQRSGAVDTSDIVAEAAVRFFTADLFANIQDRQHFQNWLRQLVRGKKIDLARREAARPVTPLADDSGLAPTDPSVQDFVLIDLRELIAAFPLNLHDTALTLMECGDERRTAIALGVSRHEVRTQMAAIRQIWADKLGKG